MEDKARRHLQKQLNVQGQESEVSIWQSANCVIKTVI